MDAARPTQTVDTSGLMCLMVSKTAIPAPSINKRHHHDSLTGWTAAPMDAGRTSGLMCCIMTVPAWHTATATTETTIAA